MNLREKGGEKDRQAAKKFFPEAHPSAYFQHNPALKFCSKVVLSPSLSLLRDDLGLWEGNSGKPGSKEALSHAQDAATTCKVKGEARRNHEDVEPIDHWISRNT